SPYGMDELRKLFTNIQFKQIIPGEVYQFEVEEENDEALSRIAQAELIFVRHIQPIDRELIITGNSEADSSAIREMISYIESSVAGKDIAVHIRTSHNHQLSLSKQQLKEVFQSALTDAGATV